MSDLSSASREELISELVNRPNVQKLSISPLYSGDKAPRAYILVVD